MENQSKPGKVFTLRTQFIGKHGQLSPAYVALICGLMVAFVSLSCAIGVLDQNDPLFSTSNGSGMKSPTPSLNFPTDRAMVSKTYGPIAEETQQTSTDVPTPPSVPVDTAPLLYYTQAGDTLPVGASRFGVYANEIRSPSSSLPPTGLLNPNTLLIIPHKLVNTTSSAKLIPDSEVIYSPSAIDFDVEAYIKDAGGYLNTYREWLGTTQWTSGAEIVQRIASENSINPRLLLALLEYQSGWVYGQPSNPLQEDYPMGKVDLSMKDLYSQLAWAVNQLSTGYYGWGGGWATGIQFSDGVFGPI